MSSDWTKSEIITIYLSFSLCLFLYLFTLMMAVHNVFRYLIPMQIDKVLIILFYAFNIIQFTAMVVLHSVYFYEFVIENDYSQFYSETASHSYILYIWELNWLFQTFSTITIGVQWLHLAFSIQLLYNEIREE